MMLANPSLVSSKVNKWLNQTFHQTAHVVSQHLGGLSRVEGSSQVFILFSLSSAENWAVASYKVHPRVHLTKANIIRSGLFLS